MELDLTRQLGCRYSQRQCSKPAIEGYQLCKTHILEDTDCPFQQCNYVSSKSGRRCIQATLKPHKKEGLCLQHAAKLNRARSAAAKKKLKSASDDNKAKQLLRELGEYCGDSSIGPATADVTEAKHESVTSYLAEAASSSDSDMGDNTYAQSGYIWQPDSDSESIDSESEDVFKYAEILTAEEVTRITRDKLIRLQSLYIEQFKWLQNILRERRRRYLLTKGSSDDVNHTADEGEGSRHQGNPQTHNAELLAEYKATKSYHRRLGQDALMYMKSQERRRAVCDGAISEGPPHNRYRHASKHGTKYCSVKSIKCHERSLPFARYCTHHLDNDSKQVLFRRCGYVAVSGGLRCERMVVDIHEHTRCDYHTNQSEEHYLKLQHRGHQPELPSTTGDEGQLVELNTSPKSSASTTTVMSSALNGSTQSAGEESTLAAVTTAHDMDSAQDTNQDPPMDTEPESVKKDPELR